MAGSSSVPRGGRRQVDKAHRATGPDAADAAPEVADSKLYRHLVREWAWGGLSACEVQRLASLAHADEQSLLLRLGMSRDYGCPQVKSLAAIGAWGRYPGNCARDLIRLLGEPRSPPLVSFPIPLKILKPARHMPAVQNIEQAMFLPHVQFAHMWNDRKDMFDEVMLGGSPGEHPCPLLERDGGQEGPEVAGTRRDDLEGRVARLRNPAFRPRGRSALHRGRPCRHSKSGRVFLAELLREWSQHRGEAVGSLHFRAEQGLGDDGGHVGSHVVELRGTQPR